MGVIVPLIAPGTPSVQPATTIAGMVTDADGLAIEDAAVWLEVGGVLVDDVRTTSDGRFTATAAGVGPLRLIWTRPASPRSSDDRKHSRAGWRFVGTG